MVRPRRWAQACDLSTFLLSGKQQLWLCNYCESTPMRIHGTGYYRAAWPGEEWQRHLIRVRTSMETQKISVAVTFRIFFFFMKCLLLRGVYLGSYKLPDVEKISRNLQMPHEKTCHFKVYIPLGRERLFFSRYLNNASCKNLYAFSNSLTSAVIHYLVLGFIQRWKCSYCTITVRCLLMPSRDGRNFWNLNNHSVVWSLFLKHGGRRRARYCGF